MAHTRNLTLLGDVSGASNIFVAVSHDKRNLLWRAFRKTVLDPRGIKILEHAIPRRIPEMLLELVDEMCQNLDRHENQATSFQEAVKQGRGFGPSPIFPPDVVPPVNHQVALSRCMEPTFDKATLPSQTITSQSPLFDLPVPRPGLACGFSKNAFSQTEFQSIPPWLTAAGTYTNYGTGEIQPGQDVHVPFLMFERTYGHARHEIEAAINYCAMDGAAALQNLLRLYNQAWAKDDWNRPNDPVVFSCTIDNTIAIINHHWVEDDSTITCAPLCKFDLRDSEHFMHFLAWIESIEQWAAYFLLPDVKEALDVIDGTTTVKALSSPVTIEEKNAKLKQVMRLAFENIPWRCENMDQVPTSPAAPARTQEPQPKEEVIILDSNIEATFETDVENIHETEENGQSFSSHNVIAKSSSNFVPSSSLATRTTTGSSKQAQPLSPYTAGITLESSRAQDPKRVHAKMQQTPGCYDTSSPITPTMASPTNSTSSGSEPFADNQTILNRTRSHTSGDQVENSGSTFATAHVMSEQLLTPMSLGSSNSSPARFLPPNIQHKRLRSPATPETLGSGPSPKSIGFRTKLRTSLGAIKQHAKPKRVRTDNSGPPTPKFGEASMPTPAYDKREFFSNEPANTVGPTSEWLENTSQNSTNLNDRTFYPPSRNQTPSNGRKSSISSTITSTPPPRLNTISPPIHIPDTNPTTRSSIAPPSRHQTPLNAASSPPFASGFPPRNKTPLSTLTRPSPQSRQATPVNSSINNHVPQQTTMPAYTAIIPPPRGQTPPHSHSHQKLNVTTKVMAVMDQIPSAGSANYLPLRDYTGISGAKTTQTVVTGPA